MQFVVEKIEFQTKRIDLYDEHRFPIWQEGKIDVPEFETTFIVITGTVYNSGMQMDVTVSYDYEEFRTITIEEVVTEVTRRVRQGFLKEEAE